MRYLYVLSVCRGANVPVPLLPYWDDSHVSVPPSPFARSFFGASALLSIEIRAFSVVGASPSLYGRPPPFMAVPLAVTSSAFASVPPPYATVPVPLWPSPSLYGRPRPFMAVPVPLWPSPFPSWPSPSLYGRPPLPSPLPHSCPSPPVMRDGPRSYRSYPGFIV
ncbi:uncharacterized protein EDB91DRAFT_1257498 [Suillus paluster]|uniref:uncharacterized protein n=1 Tax=Suillus paluster TaxID=48578 RepID=UPI001B86848A|nr:uncharacterized protein EDB91DRAFT_1257498 [Suillus paluster]KAG1719643.1 hypothetical protein EDB91DRAFT_1257498 [Suillus paluster]